MLNKPTFGQGKLADSTEICFPCFNKIKKINGVISVKSLTTQTAKDLLEVGNQVQVVEMTRAEEIMQQVKSMGVSSFFGGKEIRELPKILLEDESIIDYSSRSI